MAGILDSIPKRAPDSNSESNSPGHGQISKTLHVRNLPSDATEQDLISLACPFGQVMNVLILKGKKQGFIQMNDLQSTATMLHYYNAVHPTIRGKTVYFQYSNRTEITSSGQEHQNHVLLVTVLNVLYPIDIDILHRVFSKYGTILKIVIFNKSAGFQSLIQFSDVNSAATAKMELDGQNIYSGCCTLRIQYSSLTSLNIKFNNEKSRDYTNPALPSTSAGGNFSDDMGIFPTSSNSWSQYPYPSYMAPPPPGGLPKVGPLTPLSIPSHLQSLSGMGGNPNNASGLMSSGNSVLIVSGLDSEVVVAHRETNLTDYLFTLFGVYGDVVRVKILHNKRDTCLIQFVNSQQAETALSNLNGCPFFGCTLKMNFSKHSAISLPRHSEGVQDETSHLTKDYSNSPLHRYKVAGSRNFQHITPPSQTLHLSNIAENTSEATLRELFGRVGTVAGFRFFPKEKRMALLQMSNLGESVEALITFHNYLLDGVNLRCSFSKSIF